MPCAGILCGDLGPTSPDLVRASVALPEAALVEVRHETCPPADSEELSGPVGPLSVAMEGPGPLIDPRCR